MSLSEFFGNLSFFQILTSIVAFLTGIYTFYKSFLEKAKVSLYPGDSVNFVISRGGSVTKFHLRCNLVNNGTKAGTVHHLEALVHCPNGKIYRFFWKLFFEYTTGGAAVQKGTDPYPIAVMAKNSDLIFIEFEIGSGQQTPHWPPGEYEFQIIGWVNKKNRNQTENLKSVFHVEITNDASSRFEQERPGGPILVPVPISEWNIDKEES